jgi:hypothetical protein
MASGPEEKWDGKVRFNAQLADASDENIPGHHNGKDEPLDDGGRRLSGIQ